MEYIIYLQKKRIQKSLIFFLKLNIKFLSLNEPDKKY